MVTYDQPTCFLYRAVTKPLLVKSSICLTECTFYFLVKEGLVDHNILKIELFTLWKLQAGVKQVAITCSSRCCCKTGQLLTIGNRDKSEEKNKSKQHQCFVDAVHPYPVPLQCEDI